MFANHSPIREIVSRRAALKRIPLYLEPSTNLKFDHRFHCRRWQTSEVPEHTGKTRSQMNGIKTCEWSMKPGRPKYSVSINKFNGQIQDGQV